jgi:flagellar assembly protein FliH
MQATKFQFETSFDDDFLEVQRIAEQAIAEEELIPPPPSFSEQEMAECRAAALAEGHAAGMAEAEDGIARTASETLQVIATEIAGLAAAQNAGIEQAHRDALTLAAAIVRKTVPAKIQGTAAVAIEDFVRDCLPQIMEEPRIVVRISDSLLDQIKQDLEQIAARSGFAGQMIVMADPDLSVQDCRIEWADGGAERDSARIWQEIDESIERFLDSPPAAQPEPAPATETETEAETEAEEIIATPTPDSVS